jgi:thiosulfate/3-mercaptopyruvate sulfurtransferase
MSTPSFPTYAELDTDSALVSCEWLRQHLDRPDMVILDATFFLPRQQRSAQEEYNSQHIHGAQFFDIDAIADRNNPLPHTLPSAEQFGRQVGRLGIDNDTWICVYDHNHFFASARAWWMFRVFGHDKVSLSSPHAALAFRRQSCCWRCISWEFMRFRSSTAPGRNGGRRSDVPIEQG